MRRLALCCALASALCLGCAHGGEAAAPRLRTYASYLPADVAGDVPLVHWRLEGKVVLVTFITTWCFPCLADLTLLSELQARYGERGLEVVLVGMDLEGHKVLDPFAAGYQLQMPLVVANERLRGGQTPFGLMREVPSRLLFARDGRLIVGYAGVADPGKLEALVAKALDESP